MATVSRIILMFAIAVLAAVAIVERPVATADAAIGLALPDFTNHPFIDTTYTGWAYTAGTTTTRAWKWSPDGWTETAIEQGAPGWAHPWTDAWEWFWRGNTWHAVQRQNIASWSCIAPGAYGLPQAITIRGPLIGSSATSTSLYRYNSLRSTRIATVAFGTSVILECGTVFADASHLTGPCAEGYVCPIWNFQPQALALVRLGSGARGYVLARDIGIIYA